MDVAALGDRGNETRQLRRFLAERAPVGVVLGGREPRLERVGEGGEQSSVIRNPSSNLRKSALAATSLAYSAASKPPAFSFKTWKMTPSK